MPDLENQITEELQKYELMPKFRDLLFKIMDETKDEKPKEEKEVIANFIPKPRPGISPKILFGKSNKIPFHIVSFNPPVPL